MVERQFGYLRVPLSATRRRSRRRRRRVLDALGAVESDATRPEILGSEVITNLSHQHAFLINRNKLGSMVLSGRCALHPGGAAGFVLRDRGERGGEGGPHQAHRLPHDRRTTDASTSPEARRTSPMRRRRAGIGPPCARRRGGGRGRTMGMNVDPAVAELIREVLAEELALLRRETREEWVRVADDAEPRRVREAGARPDRGPRRPGSLGRAGASSSAWTRAPRSPRARRAPGAVPPGAPPPRAAAKPRPVPAGGRTRCPRRVPREG